MVHPLAAYRRPEVLTYERFKAKYSYELVQTTKKAIHIMASTDELFDTKPERDICPLDRTVWLTAPVISHFNLYYHRLFKTLMFHYQDRMVVSLAGCDFNKFFQKLGDPYFVDNPFTYDDLIQELRELNIPSKSPNISNSISNSTNQTIGSEQAPIPNIPLVKAVRCNKCSYSTNEGFKDLQRHWKAKLATHGTLMIGQELGVECFRQTINPLQGKEQNGIFGGKRYFIVSSPSDYFERELIETSQRRHPINQDPVTSLSCYDEVGIGLIVPVEFVNHGVEMLLNINNILTNMMVNQKLFFKKYEVDLQTLAPLSPNDKFGSFTSVGSFGGIKNYCKVWSKVIMNDIIQMNLESPGFLVDGVQVAEVADSHKPVSSPELNRKLSRIYERLQNRDFEPVSHQAFSTLVGIIGSTPEELRELKLAFNQLVQQQSELGYLLLNYLGKSLQLTLQSSVRNQIEGQAGDLVDEEANDIINHEADDEVEDNEGIIDAGVVMPAVLDDEIIGPLPEVAEGVPKCNKYVTVRSVLHLLKPLSPSQRVIKSQILIGAVKSLHLQVLYSNMTRANIAQISEKLAKSFKELGSKPATTLSLLIAIKGLSKRTRDFLSFSNNDVIYDPTLEVAEINSIQSSLSIQQIQESLVTLDQDIHEKISELLFDDYQIIIDRIRDASRSVYNRTFNVYEFEFNNQVLMDLKEGVLAALNIQVEGHEDDFDDVREEVEKLEGWLDCQRVLVGKIMLKTTLQNTHIRSPALMGFYQDSIFFDQVRDYLYLTSEATKSARVTSKLKALTLFNRNVGEGLLFFYFLPHIFFFMFDLYGSKLKFLNNGRSVVKSSETFNKIIFSCYCGASDGVLSNDQLLELLKNTIRESFHIPQINYRSFRKSLLSIQSPYHDSFSQLADDGRGLLPALNNVATFNQFYLRLKGIPLAISNRFYVFYRDNFENWMKRLENVGDGAQVDADNNAGGSGDDNNEDDGDDQSGDDQSSDDQSSDDQSGNEEFRNNHDAANIEDNSDGGGDEQDNGDVVEIPEVPVDNFIPNYLKRKHLFDPTTTSFLTKRTQYVKFRTVHYLAEIDQLKVTKFLKLFKGELD